MKKTKTFAVGDSAVPGVFQGIEAETHDDAWTRYAAQMDPIDYEPGQAPEVVVCDPATQEVLARCRQNFREPHAEMVFSRIQRLASQSLDDFECEYISVSGHDLVRAEFADGSAIMRSIEGVAGIGLHRSWFQAHEAQRPQLHDWLQQQVAPILLQHRTDAHEEERALQRPKPLDYKEIGYDALPSPLSDELDLERVQHQDRDKAFAKALGQAAAKCLKKSVPAKLYVEQVLLEMWNGCVYADHEGNRYHRISQKLTENEAPAYVAGPQWDYFW